MTKIIALLSLGVLPVGGELKLTYLKRLEIKTVGDLIEALNKYEPSSPIRIIDEGESISDVIYDGGNSSEIKLVLELPSNFINIVIG